MIKPDENQHPRNRKMAAAFAFGGVLCLIAASVMHLWMYCLVRGNISTVELRGCVPNDKQVIVYVIPEKYALQFLAKTREAANEEHLKLMSDYKSVYAQFSETKPQEGSVTQPSSPDASFDVQRAQWRLNVFPVGGFYFRRLPSEHAISKVLTRMDGTFSVWVERNRRYLIAAETYLSKAPPRVPKNEEDSHWRRHYRPPQKQCYWYLWMPVGNVPDQNITLSMENSCDVNTPESAVFAEPYDMWEERN